MKSNRCVIPDAARCAVDQQGFPCLQVAPRNQGYMGCHVGRRISSRERGRHVVRYALQSGLRADCEARKRAGLGATCNACAQPKPDALPNRIDDTRQVHPHGEGRLRFELVFALQHEEVRKVEARRLDLHAHFARSRFGDGKIPQLHAREILRQTVTNQRLHHRVGHDGIVHNSMSPRH